MNAPIALTMLRFVLIPVYIYFFSNGQIATAYAVMVAAGATDVLDGYLARRNGQVTELGSMLDPLADKLMMLTVFLSLLLSGRIPWIAAGAMLFRDAAMISGSAFFHFRGKKTVPADTMGKLTTVLYYVAVTLIFFNVPYAMNCLWAVIALSFLTSLLYIFKFRNLNQLTGNKKTKRAFSKRG
ncbi:CDP-alcohol phosphatidyltransferase family protein [Paenibacillus sp. CC-CFT747]|nr:CDP-alcohol phosphatidyltransferase family protein [Paenibacillus sp. CC-CFT747]